MEYNGYDCNIAYNMLNEKGFLPKDCKFSYLEDDNIHVKYGFKNEAGSFCEWNMPRGEIADWVKDISEAALGAGIDVNCYSAALIGAGLMEEDVRNIFDVSIKRGR